MFNNFFSSSGNFAVYENVERYGSQTRHRHYNMVHVLHMLGNLGYRHSEYVTLFAFEQQQ